MTGKESEILDIYKYISIYKNPNGFMPLRPLSYIRVHI